MIEGACRYVVKDRMEITGARWGLEGGEAVLKLRALYLNGDFEAYWKFHEQTGVSTQSPSQIFRDAQSATTPAAHPYRKRLMALPYLTGGWKTKVWRRRRKRAAPSREGVQDV